MKIGFIGAGKVGCAFGRYLKENGLNIIGYFSKSEASSKEAAKFTRSLSLSLEELVNNCNYIFITTPDDIISDVWRKLKLYNLQDKYIFHMSGSLSSNIFEGCEHLGALGYSLHPIFPVTSKNSYSYFSKAVFTIEGTEIPAISNFLTLAKITFFEIKSDFKPKYHAAAVFASNYLVCLAKISKELLLECQIPEEAVLKALLPLMSGALDNIEEKGVEASLTGPVVRGDSGTVKRHIEALTDYKNIYSELGKVAVSISSELGKLNESSERELLNILRGADK